MSFKEKRNVPEPGKTEVSIPNIRWMAYLKNGKIIVENHEHGRTWRKVYKDNYGNIEALCFQLIPEGKKFFVPPSPTGEYWTFEDMSANFGGSTFHDSRSICSKKESVINSKTGEMQAYWNVITIDKFKNVTKSIKTSEEIGYSTLR